MRVDWRKTNLTMVIVKKHTKYIGKAVESFEEINSSQISGK
jgi:hypothetical protein